VSLSPAARDVVLALADDEICLGHWYATWIGLGPFLEEDLAFTSIGQDELGHARALLALVEPAAGALDVDALAFGRPAAGYRCAWLCEQPSPTWEDLFIRHLLYDEAETVRWEALVGSTVPGLGAVAERALAEERYHTRHAESLFSRLMAGGDEARGRLLAATERLLPLAAGLFEATAGEAGALAEGVLAESSAAQASRWGDRITARYSAAGHRLSVPDAPGEPGGRRGVRSPHWPELYGEMTKVYALDPSAQW
jgi:ring-1,2-phenylacetyl-CoA epoxidase subunit PaaC